MSAKLTPQLRRRLESLGPNDPVAVSVRLEPISPEDRPSGLSRREAREWLTRRTKEAQAHVVELLEREGNRVQSLRFWSHYLANRIGAEAPRRVVEALAKLDAVNEIALLSEGDEALQY